MKILVLAPPMEEAGGVQVYTTTLVRALRRICGVEVVRLLAVPGPPASDSGRALRLSPAAKGRFFWRAFREAVSWRPGLCICTHVALAPLGYSISAILGCPFWVSAHGIEIWGKLSPWKQRALCAAGKVLAVSAFTRERVIQRHALSASRVIVLPNVLDEDLLAAVPDNRKLSALNLAQKRPILTVARLSAAERYKGHDVMLHALPTVIERVPNAVYLIAGDGDDRGRLEGLARELGVHNSVFFLGQLNRAELAACYRACEAFALPARMVLDDLAPKGEGFGIVFLEALAFGRPLIGPRLGAPTEFIRQAENGCLVDPEDPQDVAAALISLLSQPDLARKMGERGRRLVEEQYSLNAMVRRLDALLRSAN